MGNHSPQHRRRTRPAVVAAAVTAAIASVGAVVVIGHAVAPSIHPRPQMPTVERYEPSGRGGPLGGPLAIPTIGASGAFDPDATASADTADRMATSTRACRCVPRPEPATAPAPTATPASTTTSEPAATSTTSETTETTTEASTTTTEITTTVAIPDPLHPRGELP